MAQEMAGWTPLFEDQEHLAPPSTLPMNPSVSPSGVTRIPRWLAHFLILLGFSGVLFAQAPATGTVTGRVYNPATQEYIRNAEVRLESLDQVVYTESDGTFKFTGVPAGETAITVSYSGYDTARQTFALPGAPRRGRRRA
jgi:hypothetical protein